MRTDRWATYATHGMETLQVRRDRDGTWMLRTLDRDGDEIERQWVIDAVGEERHGMAADLAQMEREEVGDQAEANGEDVTARLYS